MIEQVPEIKESFESFIKNVFEDGVLSDRDKALVALATVAAFEDGEGINQAVMACRQISITNAEIGHVFSITMAMKSQKIFKLVNAISEKSRSTKEKCC